MVERNTTRVAERLGLTQSAVSQALSRLREDFRDDLLVRGTKEMLPTPLAMKLRLQIAPIVKELDAIYRTDDALDLQRVEARLVIATPDYIESTVLPSLIKRLRLEAPGITVVSRPTSGVLPRSEMEAGRIDLAIAGYFKDVPEGFYQQKIFSDTFRTAVRKGHPALKNGKLSLKDFAAAEHVLISPQGDLKARMDDELKKRGMARRVVVGVSSFFSSAWVALETDLVLTATSRDLERAARYLPLQIFPTPLELPALHTMQVWHDRTNGSALHKWFRAAVLQAAKAPN